MLKRNACILNRSMHELDVIVDSHIKSHVYEHIRHVRLLEFDTNYTVHLIWLTHAGIQWRQTDYRTITVG